jgi:glycosyltransferase involved in cell wall biosynthesis
MKICFLGDMRSIHVQKFVKWFAPNNETHLISFDYRGDGRSEKGLRFFQSIGTRVYILPKIFLPFAPAAARDIIRKIQPDIVQCHFITNYGFLGAFSGVHPLVMSAMGDDILIHPFHPLLGYSVRYALERADYVTCDGMNSLEALTSLGVPTDRQLLAYPGVDMNAFNPSNRNVLSFKMVFYPRGFDKIYDVDTLLDVIEMVSNFCPEVIFILAGQGTEKERFKKALIDKNLTSNALFLGTIDNSKMASYLPSADVSITCSLSDGGIPTSTIEAMACGVPVISTDAGDASVWIKDGENGYVVEKRDWKAMGLRVIELLKSPPTRDRFGKNARKTVEHVQNYSEEMNKIETLYSQLINIRR